MKKQQIPFDFSKWGQDGISAQFNNGVKIFSMHVHPSEMDTYYGVCETHTYCNNSKWIEMYQEIKPREIWVNEQQNSGFNYSAVFSSKAEAEAHKLPMYIRSVKFIEVLNDEQ